MMHIDQTLYKKDPISGDYPIHFLINVFAKNVTNGKRIIEIFEHYKIDFQAKNNDNWVPLH